MLLLPRWMQSGPLPLLQWAWFAGLSVLALAAPCEAWARDRGPVVEDFLRTTWTAKDGAPADVWAIAQTRDGWIWFGGPSGLYRFDGIRFRRVDLDLDRSGRSQRVTALYPLPSGELLVGHAYGGISLGKDGRFVHFEAKDVPGASLVLVFGVDAENTPLAGTEAGLLRLAGQRWERLAAESNVPTGPVTGLQLDHTGTLWVATSTDILRLQRGSGRFEITGLPVGASPEFIQSPDGRYWYSDDRGVHALPVPAIASARHSEFRGAASYISLFDREGDFWSVYDGHFERPSPGRLVRGMRRGMNPKTLLEDREGNIWMSDLGAAIHRLRRPSFTKVSTGHEFTTHVGLACDERGTVWAAMSLGAMQRQGPGVWRIEPTIHRVQAADIPVATTVIRDPLGGLWAGGFSGIWRHDGERFVKQMDLPEPGRHVEVRAITRDPDGGVWAAITGFGLYRHDGVGWRRNGGLTMLPNDPPRVQSSDAAGRIWLGYTDGTVHVTQRGSATKHGTAEGLDLGPITAISHGRHRFVAGERGLAVWKDERFHELLGSEPHALRGVTGMAEAANGDLWINGARGAARLAAAAIDQFLSQPTQVLPVELFTADEGYPGTGAHYPGLWPSLAVAPDGRIWLAGSEGIAWLDPRRLRRDPPAPLAVLESVNSGDHRQLPTGGVLLEADTRKLDIEYTALNYSNPDRLRFRYRLDNVDDDWVDAGARRQAFYTNLQPGRYRFEVSATNGSGAWSPPGTVIITIPPTFTQSRTFTVLCVAAATAALILLYQLRIRQVAARQRSRYEERLGERERIARELHDTLLQGTQGLILHVHQAAKQIDKSEAAHQLLQKALDQADAVMAEGRDRIQDLRIGWDSRLDLSESLAAVGHDLARDREVRFVGKIEGQARQLTALAREEAYRIAREALLNAFEHAQAASIELQVIYGEEALRVRVRDDGMGIEADAVARGSRPGHWGLVGMRERAHAMSARLDVWSKRGAGTEVELVIPAEVAYVSASRRQGWWPLRRTARCSN